jgi:hypothetical protein
VDRLGEEIHLAVTVIEYPSRRDTI